MPVALVRSNSELRSLLRTAGRPDHCVLTEDFEAYHGSPNPNLMLVQRGTPTYVTDIKEETIVHTRYTSMQFDQDASQVPTIYNMVIKAGTVLGTTYFEGRADITIDGHVLFLTSAPGFIFKIWNADQLRIKSSEVVTEELYRALQTRPFSAT